MNLFDFIKSQVSIWDIAQEYVTLHKAGNYWKGRCPFHHEKTASFTISPHKEIFYCFGCHAGGDVIAFIQKAEHCSPLEAATFLIERYNINVPSSLTTEHNDNTTQKSYHNTCGLMAQWCHLMLKKHPFVMSYLVKRGISEQSIDHFTIGYFPGGLQNTQSFIKAMTTKGLLLKDLIDAQLIVHGKTVAYSPFEERIIFPIKDHLGRFCGFGGRIIKPEDQRPKYYNSRENHFFTKGSLLFGLDLAKKKIQETGNVFVVEGYTDCIAMAQAGYTNTVATLGTACTIEHLKHLSRLAHTLYLVYDGDQAGQNAVLRLTQLCWQVNLDLKVITLPVNDDPASFLHAGKDLKEPIAQAKDIFSFYIERLGSSFSQKSLGEKLQTARTFLSIIAELDDPLKQDILLQKAAATVDIPFESLKEELKRTEHRSAAHQPKQSQETASTPAEEEPSHLEKRLFCAILNNVELLNHKGLPYIINYLPPSLKNIVKKIDIGKNLPDSFDFTHFFGSLNESEQQLASRLLVEYGTDGPETYPQLIQLLYKKLWKKITVDIQLKIAQAKEQGNEEEISSLVQEFIAIKQNLLPQAAQNSQAKNRDLDGKKNIRKTTSKLW